MKAAYLAFDQNSLAALPVLSNYFEQIDFYLIDEKRSAQQIDLNEISLMTEHLVIPMEKDLKTVAHQKILKSLHRELYAFKHELSLAFKANESEYTEVQKNCQTEINPISLVKDIVFNPKSHEVYFEKDKTGISTYNYLFVENHQIVAENMIHFAKNIFKKSPRNSHVSFSIEFSYELKKPRRDNLGEQKFILVKDQLNRSIFDNWFFVKTLENNITVQQWVPFNQFKNSDFQKFIIERAENLLKERLDIIHTTKLNEFYANSTPSYLLNNAVLKNNKVSSLIPAFNFWSQDKINRYVYLNMDLKMKELHKVQLLQMSNRG